MAQYIEAFRTGSIGWTWDAGIALAAAVVAVLVAILAHRVLFGVLKRERVYRTHYRSRDEARADLFDYLAPHHGPVGLREVRAAV